MGLDWDAWKRSIGGQIGLRVSMQPVIATESAAAQIGIAMNTLTGFGKQDRPILAEQNLTNRFTLQNQGQRLPGTLERETSVQGRRGTPGLKDIPVFKYIFSLEIRAQKRSRLFIPATPVFSNVAFNTKSIEDREVQFDDDQMGSPMGGEAKALKR